MGRSVRDYEVGPICGVGSFAEVRKVLHIPTGDLRAMKYPRPEYLKVCPELNDFFEREADFLEDLNHPNIVRMHEYFMNKGMCCIVTEYLPENMKSYLGNRPGLDKIYNFMRSAVEALSYVHDRGIVHCDVKPSQFLLDLEGRIKLTDFNSARFQGDLIELRGPKMPYMPDFVGVAAAEPAIDLYSLGRSVTRLMLMAQGHSEEEIEKLILREKDVVPVAVLRKDFAPEYLIQAVIENCLYAVERCSEVTTAKVRSCICTFGAAFGLGRDKIRDLYSGKVVESRSNSLKMLTSN